MNNHTDSIGHQPNAPEQGRTQAFCRYCGALNDTADQFCRVCWVPLKDVVNTEAESRQVVRRISWGRVRGRALRYGALGVVAVTALVYLLAQIVQLPVSKPTTRASAAIGTGQWGLLGGDLAHTASLDEGPALQGEMLWAFQTEAPLRSAPVMADGVVYQATGDARIVALDATDGHLLWEYKTTGPVDSSPALSAAALYVGLRDGRILALRRADGQLVWAFRTGSAVGSAPAVFQGAVYAGSGDGKLYALDAQTGKELWSFDTEGWIVGTPVFYRNIVAVANLNGDIHFIDWRTGKKRLRYNSEESTLSSPAFSSDRLLLGTELGTLLAVDSQKLEYPLERALRKWRFQFFIWGYQSAPVPKGFIWGYNFRRNPAVSSPAVTDGSAYLITNNGVLHAFDVATGERLWTYNARSASDADPVVGGDFVYMGTDSGEVHVVNRHTGEPEGVYQVTGPVLGQMVVANDTLFVASKDGAVYAVR